MLLSLAHLSQPFVISLILGAPWLKNDRRVLAKSEEGTFVSIRNLISLLLPRPLAFLGLVSCLSGYEGPSSKGLFGANASYQSPHVPKVYSTLHSTRHEHARNVLGEAWCASSTVAGTYAGR